MKSHIRFRIWLSILLSGVKIFNVTGSLVGLAGATTKTLSYTGKTIHDTWECVYEYTNDNTSLSIRNNAIVVSAYYGYGISRVYKLPSELQSKLITGCTRKDISVSYNDYGGVSWNGSSTTSVAVISLVNGAYPSYTLSVTRNSSSSSSTTTVPLKAYNTGIETFCLLSAFSGTTATLIKNATGLSSVSPSYLMMNLYGANPSSLAGLSSISFDYLE